MAGGEEHATHKHKRIEKRIIEAYDSAWLAAGRHGGIRQAYRGSIQLTSCLANGGGVASASGGSAISNIASRLLYRYRAQLWPNQLAWRPGNTGGYS